MNNKGFTLTELMVVFLICIVLCIVPMFNHWAIETGINLIKAAQHQPLVDIPWWVGIVAIPAEPLIVPLLVIALIASFLI